MGIGIQAGVLGIIGWSSKTEKTSALHFIYHDEGFGGDFRGFSFFLIYCLCELASMMC